MKTLSAALITLALAGPAAALGSAVQFPTLDFTGTTTPTPTVCDTTTPGACDSPSR